MKDNKKYIKLSLSTAILISIIIILLIALIISVLYIHFSKNTNETNSNNLSENLITYENSATNNTQSIQNVSTNTSSTPSIESGEELDINDTVVNSLVEKLNFDTPSMASIYKTGGFNTSTIPNDLILRLGWDNLNPSDKSQTGDGLKETVTSSALKKSISNIFGNDINYTDSSFSPVDVSTFHGYSAYTGEMGIVNYSNNLYTANVFQGGGGDVPFIHNELQKAIKYNDKIELYVNPVFVDSEYIDENNFNYTLYKNFDFDTETFIEPITEILSSDYYNTETNSMSNQTVANLANRLDTYVFTFKLDSANGTYYLAEFNNAN